MTTSTYINRKGEKILVDSTGFKIKESNAKALVAKMAAEQAQHRREMLPIRIQRLQEEVQFWAQSLDKRAAEFLAMTKEDLAECMKQAATA